MTVLPQHKAAGAQPATDFLTRPVMSPQWTRPLEEYDSVRYGPLLGVSDEGSAGDVIAAAAHAAPKMKAFASADPMVAGVIIDGERMTSAGEVPIGPDEYQNVVHAAVNRTLCTTNVGVRVNARLYQVLPEIDASGDPRTVAASVFERFAAFIKTPDLKLRPLVVRLLLEPGWSEDRVRAVVQAIEAGRAENKLGGKDLHRLSLLLVFDNEIDKAAEAEILRTLHFAETLGLPEVAIDGELLEGARRRLSVPSLLNVIAPDAAGRILDAVRDLKVLLTYRYAIDTASVARTVWTGLHTARSYGLTAAKYGLVPLTLEEQVDVVRLVETGRRNGRRLPRSTSTRRSSRTRTCSASRAASRPCSSGSRR